MKYLTSFMSLTLSFLLVICLSAGCVYQSDQDNTSVENQILEDATNDTISDTTHDKEELATLDQMDNPNQHQIVLNLDEEVEGWDDPISLVLDMFDYILIG